MWIIQGSNVPLAVRKLLDATTDEHQYQLIGEAYVRGLTHREALDGKDSKWETLCLIALPC